MKIQYFPETDTLAIELTKKPIASTDAITDDLTLDYDFQGKVVAITIDNYSKNVDALNLQTFNLPLLSAQFSTNRRSLIDAIVYQLYELTEEERAIVEGKNVKDANSKEIN